MNFNITELLEYLSKKSDNVNTELIDFIEKISQYNLHIYTYYHMTEQEKDIVFCYQCPFGKSGIINITTDNSFNKILSVCCVKEYKLRKIITDYITTEDIILINYKGEEAKVWNEFRLPTTDLEYAYDIVLYCMKSIKITQNEMKKHAIRKMFDKE